MYYILSAILGFISGAVLYRKKYLNLLSHHESTVDELNELFVKKNRKLNTAIDALEYISKQTSTEESSLREVQLIETNMSRMAYRALKEIKSL